MSVLGGEGLKHLGYADVKHHCASYDHHPATPAGHNAMSVLDGEGLKQLGEHYCASYDHKT